jgi:GH25 family lysozyme M1 (1,4-beta-N-acetylmuramidase)
LKPIVDISFWQPASTIDYDKLAESVSGVILRGAYGIWVDTQFEKHYEELLKRNVPIGVYHYVIGNYTGKQQAAIFYEAIKGKKLRLGLWNDVEDRRPVTGLTSDVVIQYHNEIEKLYGKKVGIYTGVYAWFEIMGSKSTMFADRDLWIAHYGVIVPSLPRYSSWKKWVIWQHTDNLKVDWYYSGVDGNKFNGTDQEYNEHFKIVDDLPPTIPIGKFWCEYCGQYTENDSRGHCGKCGAPREGWVPQPTPAILKTLRVVTIRKEPNTSATSLGMRSAGSEVEILDIYVSSASSVWVKDAFGWSAIVHAGIKYME